MKKNISRTFSVDKLNGNGVGLDLQDEMDETSMSDNINARENTYWSTATIVINDSGLDLQDNLLEHC